jgi:hypothetical protein
VDRAQRAQRPREVVAPHDVSAERGALTSEPRPSEALTPERPSELQRPRGGAPLDPEGEGGRTHRGRLFYPAALGASVALAAVSLMVLPNGVGYDPWSWLIWGRELAHGQLSTSGAASSFKPLPVVFTTIFAFTGSAEPDIWLVIARVFLAFRLGWRLRGRVAGLIAAGGLLTSLQYVSYLAPAGMSEPIGATFGLAAVDAHLSKRRVTVLVLLLGASLVRIELSAFVVVYGAWWVTKKAERRVGAALVVVGLIVVVPLAWLLPDLITSGDALRSAAAATHESQGGPLLSRYPGLACLGDASTILIAPLTLAWVAEIIVGLVAIARGAKRRRPTLELASAALALVVVEALMAQARVATGAFRYELPAVALGSVVAGCAWVDATRTVVGRLAVGQLAADRRWRRDLTILVSAAVLIAASVPGVVSVVGDTQRSWRHERNNARLAVRLPAAIREAGGRVHVVDCGPIDTVNVQVPLVTWGLHLKLGEIGYVPPGHGTIFSVGSEGPTAPAASRSHYTTIGPTSRFGSAWNVLTTCPPEGS